MPDFDFDAFNHEGEDAYEPNATPSINTNSATAPEENAKARDDRGTPSAFDARVTPSAPPSTPEASAPVEEHDDAPIHITEKKPLEARDTPASAGDNLSGEEVDKW